MDNMVLLSFAYTFLSTFAVSHVLPVSGSPAPAGVITPLTKAEITSFKPFSYYANTAYCDPSFTRNWTCGLNCEANPTFEPVASGGDGDKVQFWFVGFDPTLDTVVVSHQGTDFSKIHAVLTDADVNMTKLDSGLFPGVSRYVEIHRGFGDAHARIASTILAEGIHLVNFQANSVATQGLAYNISLGAAIALLDSVFLALYLHNVIFKTVVYAMPRVGNQAFADYVDEHLYDFHHINNKKDPVAISPERFLGYHHPSGEIHIGDDNAWYVCPDKGDMRY
ncbi:hypothetical protein NLI96_g5672 [Meripilus lineatus]|uniref:Fungal lipase-type domain-containing protein n=1 Tax=Meripilus lineatus TaxID=2056292 RepID=A0AAD5V2M4_9APHY|nr:hypothetical protein NLI96_g5672 [Physisporinus lineatus]